MNDLEIIKNLEKEFNISILEYKKNREPHYGAYYFISNEENEIVDVNDERSEDYPVDKQDDLMEEPDTNNESDQPEESITYYNIRTDLKATNKIIITTSKSGESNY